MVTTDEADRFAMHIGREVARGRPPTFTAELESFIDRTCHDAAATLDRILALQEHDRPDAGTLATGHLVLLSQRLLALRNRRDLGFGDAATTVEAFQERMIGLLRAGEIDEEIAGFVNQALHEAGIEVSEDLVEAIHSSSPVADSVSEADLSDLLEIAAGMLGGDAYALIESIARSGLPIPAEKRAQLAPFLARSDNPAIRDAAMLLLLDGHASVRRATAAAMLESVEGITPASLRRLTATRNWRPDEEVGAVDAIMREARSHGIASAPAEAMVVEDVLASPVDGSGAQGVLVVLRNGRSRAMASILMRNGVRDAFISEPLSRRDLEATVRAAEADAGTVSVERAYVDRLICHNLHRGLGAGAVPPVGLLQVAEAMGAVGWDPRPIDWREELGTLLADAPVELMTADGTQNAIATSDTWTRFGRIAESWFEDGPHVHRLIAEAGPRGSDVAASRILSEVTGPRREAWAETFGWVALWMRATRVGGNLPWARFALLAKAMVEGADVTRIPAMREIAERTVRALDVHAVPARSRTKRKRR